jgi:hypothetical protein
MQSNGGRARNKYFEGHKSAPNDCC